LNKIDVLAFRMHSFDTASFVADILSFSENAIIVIFDFQKITVFHKPAHIKLKTTIINSASVIRAKSYFLKASLAIWNTFLMFKVLVPLCFKYRPRICWIENTDAAVIIGIMRRLHFCGKSIYLPGDWLAASKDLLGKIKKPSANIIFPLSDYLACKLSDVVLNHAKEIAEARYEFWGKKIARKEELYRYKMRIMAKNTGGGEEKKAICFLGNMREDSGLDIAIRALPEIRKKRDVVLYVIGPKGEHDRRFQDLAAELKVEQYVIFWGFVETDKLAEKLLDCFCGIFLLTNMSSYSSYTIPGKLAHYLQHLLPVIITRGAGSFSFNSEIQGNALGIVIEPTKDAFIDAILKIYDEKERYRENIIRYIDSMPEVDIRKMLEA